MHAYSILEIFELLSQNNNGAFDQIRNGLEEESQSDSLKLLK